MRQQLNCWKTTRWKSNWPRRFYTSIATIHTGRFELRSKPAERNCATRSLSSGCVIAAGMTNCCGLSDLTLLYEHCHYPYRHVRAAVEAGGEKLRNEIIELGMRHRGRHDELLRPFCSGQRFRFDILMDIGGFRDMHRHRRCIQIGQGFSVQHGYDVPDEVDAAGERDEYESLMKGLAGVVEKLACVDADSAQYAIPLGFRKRTLFKMDLAEVAYISELRTGPAGHISYRRVAYAMYEAVAKKYPSLAKYFRVTDVREPVDLLKR